MPEATNVPRNRRLKQIVSHWTGKFPDLLAHSMLGAADVYNLLPGYIVEAASTKEFQHSLQELAVVDANNKFNGWQNLFSPRQALGMHTVRDWFEWRGHSKQHPVVQTMPNVNVNKCVTAWLHFGND